MLSIIISMIIVSFIDFEATFVKLFKDKISKKNKTMKSSVFNSAFFCQRSKDSEDDKQ